MNAADVRFLFGYDRYATRKLLDAAVGVDDAVWGAVGVVGDRGLGSILVHMLGAHMRWRHAFLQDGKEPRPEEEPLPSVEALRARWDEELATMEAWLETVSDGFMNHVEEGVPV